MISMPQIQSIRSRRRNGESIASIARSERVSEPTVRKYLRVDDLSARPPVRRRRGSVIDEWLPMIEGMLAEDRETWRKQRHTATRIHERLRDEYGAGVSLSTVTRTVARLRREAAAEREAGFLDLSWHPGECQADFGQVDVRYRGVVVFCQVGVGRFGVSFSPCERRVSGRFGVGRSCWLLVIALVIA